MRGRKPKPTALEILAGNPGKRRLNLREPKPESSIPNCPEHLSREAQIEWERIAPELARLAILTALDRAALAAYCSCWGRWVEAERHVREHGMTVRAPRGIKINPSVRIANNALQFLLKFAAEFGLTPSSRSRIVVGKPDGQERDDVEKYFR